MNPTLASVLNGNHVGSTKDYPAVEGISAVRWMSWQEIADRLQIIIEETATYFTDNIDPIDLHPDSAFVAAANSATVALDLVALRHMHALATQFAIAFEKENR